MEVKDRKCFLCEKVGHVARDCKLKKAPVKAVEAAVARRHPVVLCVQVAPPRPQGKNLEDHIALVAPKRTKSNIFQPLTLAHAGLWEDVSRLVLPSSALFPLTEADFPLLKPSVCDSPRVRLSQEGMSKVIFMGNATPVGDGGSDIACAKAPAVTRMQTPKWFNKPES